jgi:hypothetical protein
MVGKITFHWCHHHGFWTVHKPSECTLATTAPAGAEETTKPGSKAPQTKIAHTLPLSWAQATAAILGNSNDDTQEELDA